LRVYLDTSALVKRYVTEAGSELVDSLWEQATVLVTSVTTAAEAQAGFAKAARTAALAPEEADRARVIFLGQWPDFVHVPVSGDLALSAGQLAVRHGLRGYDSIHLASALFFAFAVQDAVDFATFDRSLWRAGESEGLRAWPPALGT
jgi:predicted nucleic acid-binding protein